MSKSLLSDANTIFTVIDKLFDEKPPVLVDVRFPKMGISSDWFLCDNADALKVILDRLGPGVEVHLSSVWDLKTASGSIVFRVTARNGGVHE